MKKKDAFALILIIVGAILLFGAAVFWYNSLTSGKPLTWIFLLLDSLTTIAGLVAFIKGWVDLFRKDTNLPAIELKATSLPPEIAVAEPVSQDEAGQVQESPVQESQAQTQGPVPASPSQTQSPAAVQAVQRPAKAEPGIPQQGIYTGITPRQADDAGLQAGLALLKKMPVNKVPNPGSLADGSWLPDFRISPLFVGREGELKQMAAKLKRKRAVAIGQAANGMGGIGKTQLAWEFARCYGQYFAGGVYWLNFDDPQMIPFEMVAFAGAGGDGTHAALLKRVLSSWQSELPRLLIFDNCNDPGLLAQWLPPGGGSRVLLTTRQEDWDPALDLQVLPLGLLDRSESISLLRGFRDDLGSEDPDLQAIATELGDLPLALSMAGSFLRTYRHDISPHQYLEELLQMDLFDQPWLQTGMPSLTPYDQDVCRTFITAINRLDREKEADRLALDLLKMIACYTPGELVGRDLLRASAGKKVGPTAFADGLNRLVGLGLVEQNDAGTVRMHALVGLFVAHALADDAVGLRVEQALDDAASQANWSSSSGRMQTLLPHLKHVTDRALSKGSLQSARLASRLGYYLVTVAEHAAARPYFEKALAIRWKNLGAEHPDTALSLNNLGYLLGSMGNYVGARPYFEKALAIRRKVLGKDHPDTAVILNNMGSLLQNMGDLAGARSCFEQSLAISRTALGEEHPQIATNYTNLGTLLQVTGDFAGTRACFEQALAIRKKVLGEEHPLTAASLNNLGVLFKATGDQPSARPFLEQALAIRKKVLGEMHPDTAISLDNLGGLLQETGEFDGARACFEQALAIRSKVLGEEHSQVAVSLNNLGGLLQARGDLASARPYYEKALAISQKALGEEHPETALIMNNLGHLLEGTGDHADARPYYEKALAIRQKVLGKDHPDTASSLNDLGWLLAALGDIAGARVYLVQYLAIMEKSLGRDHPDTIILRENLEKLMEKLKG